MTTTHSGLVRSIAILVIGLAMVVATVPVAHAQTFSVIHTFGSGEGYYPFSATTIRAGNLYGTTAGGINRPGSVFQVAHAGSNWSTTPLALFDLSGYGPYGNADFGPDGHLYSTTEEGGAYNRGTVFALVPPVSICRTAECFWTKTVVHDFRGKPQDGDSPGAGSLAWDQQGNLYGTTLGGGTYGWGTVFKIAKSGNNWTETLLHSFTDGDDGADPHDGLVLDNKGNLFGTAGSGGGSCAYEGGCGTIFELTPTANGWQLSLLYRFSGLSDGGYPNGMIFDKAGNLYGTTEIGGNGLAGTIYELSPVGNQWTFKVLYSFSGREGCGPASSLTMDAAGNLYGATVCAGAYQWGSVFKLTNTPNGWVETTLHDFTGGEDGAYPEGSVRIDSDGTMYGTAAYGGSGHDYAGNGVVWQIKP